MNRMQFLICRAAALFFSIVLIQAVFCAGPLFGEGDNFNDNSKDTTRWGTDSIFGNGVLTEQNQRLEYTCASPTFPDDDVDRPWVLRRFPYNTDWEIQIDTFNATSPAGSLEVDSFGFQIFSPLTTLNSINVELYSSALGGGPARNGFDTNLDTNDVTVATTDTGDLAVTNGAVRMVFTAATKVITVFYDSDVSNGYQWVQYGSFGIAGAAGLDGNTDWGLSDTDQFTVFVYGFSQGMVITSGQMYGDNFMETGGVGPTGPPPPAPTGSFHLLFPTDNPFLTAIAYITGNYHGAFPTTTFLLNRNYDLDVAQDDTGKLMVMGTLEGVKTTNGSPDLLVSVGEINTVAGDPTAQLNGSFSGTVDNVTASATSTATVPVSVGDIGSGTQGITGTYSHQATVAGVPFSGSNVAFQAEAPPGSIDNLHKDWSLQLDITGKGKKKIKLKVGATLVLPNGDTIVFKPKAAKFASATGFGSLAFSKGKNTMTNKKDKLTTVTLTGLTFAFQNGAWHPTGGTINYNFLGQQGTANLTDFIFTP